MELAHPKIKEQIYQKVVELGLLLKHNNLVLISEDSQVSIIPDFTKEDNYKMYNMTNKNTIIEPLVIEGFPSEEGSLNDYLNIIALSQREK